MKDTQHQARTLTLSGTTCVLNGPHPHTNLSRRLCTCFQSTARRAQAISS